MTYPRFFVSGIVPSWHFTRVLISSVREAFLSYIPARSRRRLFTVQRPFQAALHTPYSPGKKMSTASAASGCFKHCCFLMVQHRVRCADWLLLRRGYALAPSPTASAWPPVVSKWCNTLSGERAGCCPGAATLRAVSAASGCSKQGRLLFPNGATPCPLGGLVAAQARLRSRAVSDGSGAVRCYA
jgi:hypothetical protein